MKRKSLIIIGGLAALLLLILVVAPLLFKGPIKKIADDAIAESVNAKVSYHDFGLSLIRNFPNLSLSVDQLAVVGLEEFAGDTLVAADQLSVSVNLFKAIFSDQLTLKRIALSHPKLLIQVLESGKANYDIAKESEVSTDQEASEYQFSIEGWEVENGSLIYRDRQLLMDLELNEITHSGRGDFTQDLFDLTTSTKAKIAFLRYEDVEYLTNKLINAEVTLEMNMPESKYTFKDNRLAVNDLTIGVDGSVTLPEDTEDILMDLHFITLQNDFKDLLSCVPGMYLEGFENMESSGTVDLEASVKGTYNEEIVPAFDLALNVDNGRFKYPDLPTAVENINLAMTVSNQDGNIDNTLIDISQLHMDFGSNPLDGALRIDGLVTPEIKADLNTKLDLNQLTTMFPMEGTTLKGIYALSLQAEGAYDSVAQTFPVVNATMSLDDGYIKSSEFPESLEQFHFESTVTNNSGKLPDTRVEIPDFSFVMDGEPFKGRLTLVNPSDYTWDVAVEGGIDLEKVTHVFSLEDMTLAGTIRGDLKSTGRMSSLEAERYAEIPTSGTIEVENFSYSSPELTHPFVIQTGRTSFTPQLIEVTDIQARTGSSDMKLNGSISNYINYLFKENEPIKGRISIVSQTINLNEWMSESTEADTASELTVIEVPRNLDLTIDAAANTVYYDNMTLSNLRGQVQVQDGVAELNDVSFNSLGGGFLVSGAYDPTQLKPQFDMDIQMQEISFKQAFETFNTVKVLAPVAQLLTGNFSSSFKVNGALKPDMMPLLETLNANGLVNVITASLTAVDSKLVQGLTSLTKFQDTPNEFKLKDVIMAVKIQDGKMNVAPFNAQFGNYSTQVSGSTGIDGTMDFLLNMEVPAGVVGTSINQAIASLTNSDRPVDDKVKLNLKLTGSYNDPSFALSGFQDESSTAGQVQSAIDQKTEQARDSARAVVDQKTEEVTNKAKQQLDSLISDQITDSTSAEAIKEVAKDLLDKDNVDGVLNLFKKKKPKDTVDTK